MELLRAELMVLSSHWFCSQSLYNYTAAQCIVIGPVCGCVTGGRCPNLTTASARAQCLRLSERFFHSVLCLSFSVLFICIYSLWWRLIVFIAELVTGCQWSATNWCKSSVTSRCRSVSAGGRRCRSVHLRHYSRHWTRLHAQVCSLTLTLYQK